MIVRSGHDGAQLTRLILTLVILHQLASYGQYATYRSDQGLRGVISDRPADLATRYNPNFRGVAMTERSYPLHQILCSNCYKTRPATAPQPLFAADRFRRCVRVLSYHEELQKMFDWISQYIDCQLIQVPELGGG